MELPPPTTDEPPFDAWTVGVTVGSVVFFMMVTSCATGCYYGRQRHRAMMLHKAMEAGPPYVGMIREMLAAKAPVNYVFNDEWTPLHIAADAGFEDIVTVLLEAGADLNAVDGDGILPYQRAKTAA